MVLSDKGPTLEALDFTIHIGGTPTFLYFDLYLNTAYPAHYVLTEIRTDRLTNRRADRKTKRPTD